MVEIDIQSKVTLLEKPGITILSKPKSIILKKQGREICPNKNQDLL